MNKRNNLKLISDKSEKNRFEYCQYNDTRFILL